PQSPSMLAGRPDQLAALLGPDTTAAREHPCRPSWADGRRAIAICIVGAGATDDGGFAVARQRNGRALIRRSSRAGADQLRDMLIGPRRCKLLPRSRSLG